MRCFKLAIKKYFFRFTLICLMSVSSACNAANPYLEQASTKNVKLELFNENGKCALRDNVTQNKYVLSITYPCGFVRTNKQMKAQTYFYKDIGNVFVVAGVLARESDYTVDDGVKPIHKCSDFGQSIIAHKGKVTLGKAQNIPRGFCHQLGFDEKDFYGFAYPVDQGKNGVEDKQRQIYSGE